MAILPTDFAETGPTPEQIINRTRNWLEKAVIGLNLCPFAKQPYQLERIRYVVSQQQTQDGLLDDLLDELQILKAADPQEWETTLLIHPGVLNDFMQYNDFLDDCDAALTAMKLDGELQIASFHPQYQFADTQIDDIGNFSNRSPYPMLHLLREASISRAVASFAGIAGIVDNNQQKLRELGVEGWNRLWTTDTD